jgi:D-alanyl-D-alanine dipeptidase
MWRSKYLKILQFLFLILRFEQKKARKFRFVKNEGRRVQRNFCACLLTIFCSNLAFSQQISPVSSLKTYSTIIELQPAHRLVKLADYLSPLHKKVYYCTEENFTQSKLYDTSYSLYLAENAAKLLALVQDSLQKTGLDLLIFDGYRPYTVTKLMWKLVPDERYTANPAKGSGHNRGIAIDLTLIDMKSGMELEMPTGYDNFSDSAHHDFMKISPPAKQNRDLLKGVMEHFGFEIFPTEWWHYSLPDPRSYPLYDISFKELKQLAPENN